LLTQAEYNFDQLKTYNFDLLPKQSTRANLEEVVDLIVDIFDNVFRALKLILGGTPK
jgi:hypothetical protein|tara:strand:+ start:330 stop:500 length:171 start_codon:yes stop_codon:yes gene_type:complete